jgi:hypothetical protein
MHMYSYFFHTVFIEKIFCKNLYCFLTVPAFIFYYSKLVYLVNQASALSATSIDGWTRPQHILLTSNRSYG